MKHLSAAWMPPLALLGALLLASESAQARESPAQEPPSKAPTIVIFGASYVDGWGSPELPGYKQVINRGVGGQRTDDLLKRFNRDVIATHPDAVLIWGYANNITKARPNEFEAYKAMVLPHYEQMVAAAQKAGIEVILATEVPWTDPDTWLDNLRAWIGHLRGKESYAARISTHIGDVNQQIRALAAREGLRLLDFEQVFANENGTRKPEFALEDLSHISPAGYKALSAYAKRELGRPQLKSAKVL
jgi:lysophospholipase L1-like esterase